MQGWGLEYGVSGLWVPEVVCLAVPGFGVPGLRGYLAHKKQPPSLGPP